MFHNKERNNKLRSSILKQFLSKVMTDDETAELWGLPKGCRMRENAKIISPENLICGEYVWIGEGAMLDASGGLEIGAHTSIGLGVYVWSHSSFLTNLTLNNEAGSDLIIRKKTTIGKGCFIVGPSVINPGVTIGDQCMILPMSVVTKDIPSRSIVSGSPGIITGEVTDEFIERKMKELRSQQ